MKQTINNGQLAAIVTHILTNPFSGELDDQSAFEEFVTRIAQLVCDNCGGQLVSPARYAPEPDYNMDWTTHYCLEVQTTLESPEDGGIWAKSLANVKTSSVPVKYWDCYNSNEATVNTHQFDVDDQRETNGQMYLDLGSKEGNLDDMMSVTMEVNANPLNGIDHVPCAHVHFDNDALAVSLFKIGNKILVRPETNVSIEPVQGKVYGVRESLYWIDSQ